MNPSPSSPAWIVELLQPECSRRFSILGAHEITVPKLTPEKTGLHLTLAPDGSQAVHVIPPAHWGRTIPGSPHDRIAIVLNQVDPLSLTFPGLHRETNVGAVATWDLRFAGAFQVTDPARFFAAVKSMVATGAPLSHERLAQWLMDRIAIPVGEILREALSQDLWDRVRQSGVFSAGWWGKRLAALFPELGLEFEISEVAWSSPEVEKAEVEQLQRAERERAAASERAHREWLRQQADAEQAARLEQSKADARFREELDRIQAEELNRQRDLKAQGIVNEERLRSLKAEFDARREEAHQRHLEEQWKAEQRLRELQLEAKLKETSLATDIARIELKWKMEQQAAADAERQRQEDATHASILRKKELETKLAALELQAQSLADQRRQSLESDQARQSHEKERSQLELDRLNSEREKLRMEIEAARIALVRSEHEAKAAADRAEAARIDRLRAEEELRQCQKRGEVITQAEDSASKENQRLHEILKSLIPILGLATLSQLQSGIASTTYPIAATLGLLGIQADDLDKLGITTPQKFIERYKGIGIIIRKSNLERKTVQTRDLGVRIKGATSHAVPPVLTTETLRIGSPAGFSVHSTRPGYLTVINPGTTSKFWLLVPNPYRRLVRIQGGHSYSLPGDEALPLRDLDAAGLEFAEGGPEGPEYLVAIVSDEPIVDPKILARADHGSPFVQLLPEDLVSIQKRLDELGPTRWTSGVAHFQVIK